MLKRKKEAGGGSERAAKAAAVEDPCASDAFELMAGVDPDEVKDLRGLLLSGACANGDGWHGATPTRSEGTGRLRFADAPEFEPTLTPAEVLGRGSFGGGYFRDIRSGVTKARYSEVWRELPAEWLEGLDVGRMVAGEAYDAKINRHGVNCGAKDGKADAFGQGDWERSG